MSHYVVYVGSFLSLRFSIQESLNHPGVLILGTGDVNSSILYRPRAFHDGASSK